MLHARIKPSTSILTVSFPRYHLRDARLQTSQGDLGRRRIFGVFEARRQDKMALRRVRSDEVQIHFGYLWKWIEYRQGQSSAQPYSIARRYDHEQQVQTDREDY